MDWLTGTVEWLNANSGVLSSAAALVSAIGATVAAVGAIETIRRTRRRERSILDFYVQSTLTDQGIPEVQVKVLSRGPAEPLMATYDFDHSHGDSFEAPFDPRHPLVPITEVPLARCLAWCRFTASWLDPDGSRHRARFWYRATADWQAPENNRKYLRVTRDERFGYLGSGPYYLRRWLPLPAYIGWRIRKARFWRDLKRRQRN